MKSSSPEGKAKTHTKYWKLYSQKMKIYPRKVTNFGEILEEDYREILNLEAETTADPSKNDIEEINFQEIRTT